MPVFATVVELTVVEYRAGRTDVAEGTLGALGRAGGAYVAAMEEEPVVCLAENVCGEIFAQLLLDL